MSVTLHLAPDLERQLHEKATQRGQSLEEYLKRLAEESLRVEHSPLPLPPEQWEVEFRAWVAGHAHWPTHVDDSRESIYEGRGE